MGGVPAGRNYLRDCLSTVDRLAGAVVFILCCVVLCCVVCEAQRREKKSKGPGPWVRVAGAAVSICLYGVGQDKVYHNMLFDVL